MWYYGRRTAIGCHPDEFWISYFTSSSEVDKFRTLHGDPDIRKIRQIFNDTDYQTRVNKCIMWEVSVIDRIGAVKRTNWLNQHGSTWDTTGKLAVRDANGKTYHVTIADERYLSGELVPVTKGKVTVKDIYKNTFSVSVNDPRYLTGELVPITKGKVAVKDRIGNNLLVDKTDSRYLTGELIPVAKGISYNPAVKLCQHCDKEFSVSNLERHKKSCDNNPNKIPYINTGMTYDITTKNCRYCNNKVASAQLKSHEKSCINNPEAIHGHNFGKKVKVRITTCEHCGLTGGGGNMTRWHHNNCKLNTKILNQSLL